MKEKKNSETDWILFSVLSVIIPVCFAFIITSIINDKIIDLSNIIDGIILVAFSIACSLLSICRNVSKQKSDKFTTICFWLSGVTMFISWTTYIMYLTGNIIHINIVCICSLIFVILCSILGVILGKKSDKNENETICAMHKNCDLIRKKSMSKDYYDALSPLAVKDYDLLCNPYEFDRVKKTISTIVKKGIKSENKK